MALPSVPLWRYPSTDISVIEKQAERLELDVTLHTAREIQALYGSSWAGAIEQHVQQITLDCARHYRSERLAGDPVGLRRGDRGLIPTTRQLITAAGRYAAPIMALTTMITPKAFEVSFVQAPPSAEEREWQAASTQRELRLAAGKIEDAAHHYASEYQSGIDELRYLVQLPKLTRRAHELEQWIESRHELRADYLAQTPATTAPETVIGRSSLEP